MTFEEWWVQHGTPRKKGAKEIARWAWVAAKEDSLIRKRGGCKTMNYYDLPKDKRWLQDGDSPYVIGGRSTDVEQIAFSLEHIIKARYPVNKVPKAIEAQLKATFESCQLAAKQINRLIDIVSEEASNNRPC